MKIKNKKSKSLSFTIPILLFIPLILFSLQFTFKNENVKESTKQRQLNEFESPTTLVGAHTIENIVNENINNISKDSICSIYLSNEMGHSIIYYVYKAPITGRQIDDTFFLHIYLKDNTEWKKKGKGKYINMDFKAKPKGFKVDGKNYYVFKRLLKHQFLTLENIDYMNTGRYKKGIGRSYDLRKIEIDHIPLSNTTNSFERIEVSIKEKAYHKLSTKRSSALKTGVLMSEDSDFVKAEITSKENDVIESELRLKGDWTDHLTDSVKWSFKVKLDDGNTLFGMRKFSIQQPKVRNYAWEWLFNKIIKEKDLIGLRYDFLNVDLNIVKKDTVVTKDMGVMAIEESFDKILIENNKRREGVIINFDESILWADRNKQRELKLPHSGADRDLFSINTAPISVFNENKVLSTPALRSQFQVAKNLLHGLRKGELKTSEVFDIEKLAFFVALSNLFGGYHGLTWHNLRIYYNPVTNKLEPVSYDSNSGNRISKIHDYIFTENDTIYQQKLIEKLELVSSSEFVQSLYDLNYSELNSIVTNLKTEFDIYFDRSILEHNSNFIKKQIYPSSSLVSHLNGQNSREIQLSIKNISNFPITINSLKTEKGMLLSKAISETIVFPNKTKNIKFPLKDSFLNAFVSKKNKKGEFRYPKDVSKIKIDFKVLGAKHSRYGKIIPYQEENLDFYAKYKQISNFKMDDFEFISINEKDKVIKFKTGTYKANKTIRIPSGYTLQVEKGFSLDLTNQASLLSYSPMICKGTKIAPIKFFSSDGTGNGVLVSNCKQLSILEHCLFKNLSNPDTMDWALTGSVNFNEANVRITNSKFEKNRSEDGLNIIRSVFSLNLVTFSNTFSDAFDGDFVTGKLENCFFVNCGNDGIDVSGSNIEVLNIEVTNASDKAISIGEGSKMAGRQVKIAGGEIGVVSKDLSTIELNGVKIDGSQLAISSFQKKSEYGPGKIVLTNLTLLNNGLDYLIEENSELSIDGKLVETKTSKVIDKMYGNEYGKSSK